MRNSVLVLLAFSPLLFGQLDSNSITVSASRNASLQPDQAVFSVSVQSGLSASLDDVVAALQGSGLTAANLSGVNSLQLALNVGTMSGLTWVFSLPVPLANTKATVASLTTLQQNIAKLANGFTLSFSIVGTQVSQQLAQSQTCSLTGLVADATTQAQNLAAAGGMTLGAIVAMSSSTANVISSAQPGFVAFVGSFSAVTSTTLVPPCAVTVKFNASRF
jgi:uncharacterized protein YggE